MAVINGTAGSDSLRGSSENDILFGYQGNDDIEGFAGADTLYGAKGNDTLLGDSGNDLLFGGTGNDLLQGGSGNDFLSGDAGNDDLYGVNPYQNQPGSGEIDTLIGGQGQDNFYLGNPFFDNDLPARTYYNKAGNNDFALIADFDPQSDYIFLNRNDTYNLTDFNLPNLGSGVGVFVTTNGQNELIGFLPGFTSRQLVVSRDFVFV